MRNSTLIVALTFILLSSLAQAALQANGRRQMLYSFLDVAGNQFSPLANATAMHSDFLQIVMNVGQNETIPDDLKASFMQRLQWSQMCYQPGLRNLQAQVSGMIQINLPGEGNPKLALITGDDILDDYNVTFYLVGQATEPNRPLPCWAHQALKECQRKYLADFGTAYQTAWNATYANNFGQPPQVQEQMQGQQPAQNATGSFWQGQGGNTNPALGPAPPTAVATPGQQNSPQGMNGPPQGADGQQAPPEFSFADVEAALDSAFVSNFWGTVDRTNVLSIDVPQANLVANKYYAIGVNATKDGQPSAQQLLLGFSTVADTGATEITDMTVVTATPKQYKPFEAWKATQAAGTKYMTSAALTAYLSAQTAVSIAFDLSGSAYNNVDKVKFVIMRAGQLSWYEDYNWYGAGVYQAGEETNFCTGPAATPTCTAIRSAASSVQGESPNNPNGFLVGTRSMVNSISPNAADDNEFYTYQGTDRTKTITFSIPTVYPGDNVFEYGLYVHFSDGTEKRGYGFFSVEGYVMENDKYRGGVPLQRPRGGGMGERLMQQVSRIFQLPRAPIPGQERREDGKDGKRNPPSCTDPESSSSSPCNGQGNCTTADGGRARCVCATGWAGPFCGKSQADVDKIRKEAGDNLDKLKKQKPSDPGFKKAVVALAKELNISPEQAKDTLKLLKQVVNQTTSAADVDDLFASVGSLVLNLLAGSNVTQPLHDASETLDQLKGMLAKYLSTTEPSLESVQTLTTSMSVLLNSSVTNQIQALTPFVLNGSAVINPVVSCSGSIGAAVGFTIFDPSTLGYVNQTNGFPAISLDAYDINGTKLTVSDLKTPVNITLCGLSSSAGFSCVYWNNATQSYVSDGVVTISVNSSCVICQTTHFSQFTMGQSSSSFASLFSSPAIIFLVMLVLMAWM